MNLSDQELTLYALREAQLILADSEPGPRDAEKTVRDLIELLNRADLVEAVERLETSVGMRLA